MEGIAGPVSHVVLELVILYHNVGALLLILLVESEVGVLNVNRATGCANVLRENIVHEDNRTLVAFDKEGSDCLYRIHN